MTTLNIASSIASSISIDPRAARAMLYRNGAEAIRRICAVPEDISVTDWAARERILPETSSSPGAYDPSIVPYARRWQDLGADPSISRIALCWATQTTKSTVIENIIAYRIVHMPSPMVIVQPKIDAAEGWAKERFVPMVRATPALKFRVRLGRSSGSTMRYMAFPGGFVFVASAQSATEIASRSSPFVSSDEVDRMEIIPGEGNPVEIVDQRQGASDIGLHVMTSTPRSEDTTIIWPYLESGSYELYHVRCPHCGQSQPLFWCNLHWEPGQPMGAYYVCGGAGTPGSGREPSPVLEQYLQSPIAHKTESGVLAGCGATIDERAKPQMLTGGEWRATNPNADYPSSHLHGLYSPFAKSSWGALARKFEK
ncbi:MAG TPA: phage terminase large subunit family protein, partial [Casimicrobiaceae bacterium]